MTRSIGFCMALLLLSPVMAAEPPDSGVIATWKGGEVERNDYESWRRVQGLANSDDAVREYIFVQSYADLARKRRAQDEVRVKLEVEIARRKTLSAALRSHAVAQIRISDEEIEVLRQKYPDAFTRQQRLRLSNVQKKLGDDPEAAESVRTEMAEIRQQLLEGADFGSVARRESDSQSRFQDGRLGLVDPDEMPAAIAEAVRELEAGEISEVVEHDGAVMIFSCDEVKESVSPTADEVRAKLRANLWRIRKEEVEQSLGEKLLESAELEIDPRSEGVVLKVGDYKLDAGQLHVLMKIKVPDSTPSDWDDGARQKLLRNWAIGVLEERRAIAQGLDMSESTAETLRLQPVQILARNELVRQIDNQLKPPDEEQMRRHYAENTHRYRVPEQYTLGVIRFGQLSRSDAKAASQLVARAELVEKQIASGELSFGDAIQRYSTAPSAPDGGESRTLTRAQIGALGSVAGKAVAELAVGEHTELLRLRSGLWMFEVRDRTPARAKNFKEAEPIVRQDLRKQEIALLEARLREQQWELLDIEIVDEAESSE